MADNFNLRQFLSENKLTKNAKLLSEARVGNFDETKQAFEVTFTNKYGGGDSRILNAETEEQAEEIFKNIFKNNPDEVQSIRSIRPYQVPPAKPKAEPLPWLKNVDYSTIELSGIDEKDPTDLANVGIASAQFKDGTDLSDSELDQLSDELANSGELGDMVHTKLNEGVKQYPDDIEWTTLSNSPSDSYDVEEEMIGWSKSAKKYFLGSAFNGDIDIDKEIKPEKHVKTALSKYFNKNNTNENKMTAREKYITRLVENALGIPSQDHDNLDASNDDAYGKAFNAMSVDTEPADDMVQPTVIPEYNSIEELMKHIDESTNQVAELHKISEMKKIAEALRERKNSLEESEHAQYMNKADLQRLGKEILAIDKAVVKAQATFDKKFNKKEKGAAPKKEAEAEKPALQEGTFDLRKFLVENKMTYNSRLLKEYGGYAESLVGLVDEFHNRQVDAGIDSAELIQELKELVEYCNEQILQLQSEM